jgi:hypothetical protein
MRTFRGGRVRDVSAVRRNFLQGSRVQDEDSDGDGFGSCVLVAVGLVVALVVLYFVGGMVLTALVGYA